MTEDFVADLLQILSEKKILKSWRKDKIILKGNNSEKYDTEKNRKSRFFPKFRNCKFT